MKAASRGLCLLLCVASVCVSCSTKISAHKVTGTTRQGGLPFFLPKPLISIKEPIEVGRTEDLYAVVMVGDLQQYLIQLDTRDLVETIPELRALLQIGEQQKVRFFPAKRVLAVESEDTTTTVNADKSTETTTHKHALLPAPAPSEVETAPFYTAKDASKAFEILFVPDSTQEYELVIEPATFASTTIGVALQDGWRLTSVNSQTGENQIVKELSSIVQAVIGMGKDVEVAQIGKEQALELAKLEQQGGGSEPETSAGPMSVGPEDTPVDVSVRLVGYMKRVTLDVVQPGLYLPDTLIAGQLATKPVTYWKRVSF